MMRMLHCIEHTHYRPQLVEGIDAACARWSSLESAKRPGKVRKPKYCAAGVCRCRFN
jgi:hypothetical protein